MTVETIVDVTSTNKTDQIANALKQKNKLETTCPQTITCGTNQSLQDQCNTGLICDEYCDDINNKKDCNYDGGDCCGCNVNKQC